MNAFFLYRKQYKERIQQLYNTTKSHEISRIAGECWATESETVKNHFRRLSQELYEQQKEDDVALAEQMFPQVKIPTSSREKLHSRSHESFRQRMEIARSRSFSDVPGTSSVPFQYLTSNNVNPCLVSQDILDLQKIQYAPYQSYQISPIVNITPTQSPQPTNITFPMIPVPFDPIFDTFAHSPVTPIDSPFDEFQFDMPNNPQGFFRNSF
jgi:hypothetical protein